MKRPKSPGPTLRLRAAHFCKSIAVHLHGVSVRKASLAGLEPPSDCQLGDLATATARRANGGTIPQIPVPPPGPGAGSAQPVSASWRAGPPLHIVCAPLVVPITLQLVRAKGPTVLATSVQRLVFHLRARRPMQWRPQVAAPRPRRCSLPREVSGPGETRSMWQTGGPHGSGPHSLS
jgi:hypothetical protein